MNGASEKVPILISPHYATLEENHRPAWKNAPTGYSCKFTLLRLNAMVPIAVHSYRKPADNVQMNQIYILILERPTIASMVVRRPGPGWCLRAGNFRQKRTEQSKNRGWEKSGERTLWLAMVSGLEADELPRLCKDLMI